VNHDSDSKSSCRGKQSGSDLLRNVRDGSSEVSLEDILSRVSQEFIKRMTREAKSVTMLLGLAWHEVHKGVLSQQWYESICYLLEHMSSCISYCTSLSKQVLCKSLVLSSLQLGFREIAREEQLMSIRETSLFLPLWRCYTSPDFCIQTSANNGIWKRVR
jgi:hypothetical protein